jgi:hypothetical protein
MDDVFPRYKHLYGEAGEQTEMLFGEQGLDVRLSISDSQHIQLVEAWHGQVTDSGVVREPPNGGWNWSDLYGNQKGKPKRFCISICNNHDELCGVFLGGVSKGKEVVSLHYIDAKPNPTNLSGHITMIALTFSLSLAERLDATFVAVYQPNDHMKEKLVSKGFYSDAELFGSRVKFGLDPYYLMVGKPVY